MPTSVVKNTLQELVLALTPGTDCKVEEDYAKGKKGGRSRWDFKDESGIDSLDLELDLNINPDFSFQWKDLNDYEKGLRPELSAGVGERNRNCKTRIFDSLEKPQYPYDESGLHWKPNPNWSPPILPEDLDKV